MSGAPIFDQQGEVIGVVIAFNDVSQKQRLENEMMKIQKLETVGLLAGGIAHDFNNILTAILGNVSMVVKNLGPDQQKLKDKLFTAEKACFRARDLTRQLLTFSRGGDPVKKIIKLHKMLEDTAFFNLKGSEIKYKLNIAPDLKPVEVDESQISQVINNLVINAKQAMPKGGKLTIDANNTLIEENTDLPLSPGEYVEITITDSGTGIPADAMHQIFDPFFTTKQDGSGLGLTISFNIVSRHKGYILGSSKEGEGSSFTLYLPATEGEYQEEEINGEQTDFQAEGTVILMDDDEEIRATLGSMLAQLGFKVICTRNGEETLLEFEKLKKEKIPVSFILLDLIVVEGMGGKDTIKKLIKIDPEVKAIVSSGYSSDPVIAEYKKYGFKSVMEKPYTIDNLVRAIMKLTDKG